MNDWDQDYLWPSKIIIEIKKKRQYGILHSAVDAFCQRISQTVKNKFIVKNTNMWHLFWKRSIKTIS